MTGVGAGSRDSTDRGKRNAKRSGLLRILPMLGERPRVCSLCGHIFKGNGWDGVDPHYKARHERDTGIEYEQWWSSICPGHTG